MSQADVVSLARIVECLLFVAGDPVTVRDLVKTTETDSEQILDALQALRDRYQTTHSGLHIVEIAGGYQLATRPEFSIHVGKLLAPNQNRLSRPGLETVTIIAYRQPCTQAEIEAIRGVSVDGVLKTLVERELITEAGRKAAPGRPILYGTTTTFLHYFGLANLTDLPPLEDEEPPDILREREAAAETALVAAGIALEENRD